MKKIILVAIIFLVSLNYTGAESKKNHMKDIEYLSELGYHDKYISGIEKKLNNQDTIKHLRFTNQIIVFDAEDNMISFNATPFVPPVFG